MTDQTPLINIQGLTIDYTIKQRLFGRHRLYIRVLDGVDLAINAGETLGIVGESGCGKTTLGRGLLRLIEPTSGQVIFEGQDILSLDQNSLRQLRRNIQMVYQNPFSSLNPRMKVLDLIAEPLRTHTTLKPAELKEKVETLLIEVGLSTEFLTRYPHEISGGQAQRVALARALALNPKFLVLDEPTSALDVSVQAQIINLLTDLQRRHGLTYLFISHDLGVVQHISDRIAVMYLGEIVELATSELMFQSPQHPYSQALLASTPLPDPDSGRNRIILEGNVPSLANPPSGCRFHTRCPHVQDICLNMSPRMLSVSNEQQAACHLLDETKATA